MAVEIHSFCTKVHPTGAFVCSFSLSAYVVAASLHPIRICQETSTTYVPKYWLEEDGTMCLDEGHRWRSAKTLKRLQVHGRVPFLAASRLRSELWSMTVIKAKHRAPWSLHLDCDNSLSLRRCPVGQIGNACPCISQGHAVAQ